MEQQQKQSTEKEIIGRYRPVEATVESIEANEIPYSVSTEFLRRSIFLILGVLNQEGFKRLEEHFPNHTDLEYLREKEDFRFALVKEYWREFFQNAGVSMVHIFIREALEKNESNIPIRKVNFLASNYANFTYWVQSAFGPEIGPTTSFGLYFTKFLHFRRDLTPSISLQLKGETERTSNIMKIIQTLSPNGVGAIISHQKYIGFDHDNTDGLLFRYSSTSGNFVPINLTNDPFESFALKEPVDYEEHKRLHEIYFMVTGMMRAGIIEVSINEAKAFIWNVFDQLEEKFGVITKEEKRLFVLETAFSICVTSAIWPSMYQMITPEIIYREIMPRLCINTQMCIDALTTMRFIWDTDLNFCLDRFLRDNIDFHGRLGYEIY